MNYWNAYLASFNFLDNYWEKSKEDDMAMLLSSMSPYIWGNNIPIDNSMVDIWIETFNQVLKTTNNTSEVEMIFACLISYVENMQKEFTYNFADVLLKFSRASINKEDDLWINWLNTYDYWHNKPNYSLGHSLPPLIAGR